MTSRRSFVAALAGTMAAPALAKLPAPIPAPPPQYFPLPAVGSPVCEKFTFMVWDEITIEPGVLLNERLFPPPIPPNVLVSGVWFGYQADIPCADLLEVLGGRADTPCADLPGDDEAADDEAAPHVGVVVTIKRGGLTMLRAPLFTCPTQFVLAFEAGDDFGVYVQSEALNLQQPAHIVCYLSGLIRVE